MAFNVVEEAKRCLNCKNPMCRKGCPVNTPIPMIIQQFLSGQIDEAGKRLFENNPLSVVCSLVCDHEKQCEGNCVLGRKGTPVHFSHIENYISDNYLDKLNLEKGERKGQRVAIIGSGPAGITIAVILAQKGYDITIFEGREKIGGVLRYGIPSFRLPKSILDRYKTELEKLGIKIRQNTLIGSALTIDDLKRDGYKAIFIGTGVWKPVTLNIKGESLGHVHYAIDYLVDPDGYSLGETVAVIGAGNAAMDAARTAIRKGAKQVTVYARSNRIAASSIEVDYAMADGVVFKKCMRPAEICDEGVMFQKAQLDENGNLISLSEPILEKADTVIIAVSQGPQNRLTGTTKGLKANDRGLLETDESGQTSLEGIFASGDVVNGARTVVEAVSYSKTVAQAMDEYLTSLREKENL